MAASLTKMICFSAKNATTETCNVRKAYTENFMKDMRSAYYSYNNNSNNSHLFFSLKTFSVDCLHTNLGKQKA